MSYYVEYNPELCQRYPLRQSRHRNIMLPIAILLIAAIVMYVSVQSEIVKYLIPGNPDITTAAFSQLVEQVAAGESIGRSIITFCEEIITGGT